MDTHLEMAVSEALKIVGADRLWPVLIKYVSVGFEVVGHPRLALPSYRGKQGKRETEFQIH
jgi:hypothetical protein